MGAITRAGTHRRNVIDLCYELDLTTFAAQITSGNTDSHYEQRRCLLTIREAATRLVAAGDNDVAMRLESEAAKGIVACDEVIAERDAERAHPRNDRPVLSPVRLPGGRMSQGDDR